MIDTNKWFSNIGNEEYRVDHLISYFNDHKLTVSGDFVAFLKKYNGVVISDYSFAFYLDTPSDFASKDELFFYGILDVKSIIERYKRSGGYSFPDKMISLTNIHPGFIVLSLAPSSHGQVFFCESDLLEEQLEDYSSIDEAVDYFDYPNKPLPKYMFKIADSFTEFLEKIEIKKC